MKKIMLIGVVALSVLGTGCGSRTNSDQSQAENQADSIHVDSVETVSDTLAVTGKITKIENGKDGYMATVQTEDGQEYVSTISIINLQKSGGEYKSHEVGDVITVKGPSWKDGENKTYITVQELK